jgi:hypothetical protein
MNGLGAAWICWDHEAILNVLDDLGRLFRF